MNRTIALLAASLLAVFGTGLIARTAPAQEQPAEAKAPDAAARPAEAEPTAGDVPLVGEKIRTLMQDRKYTEAIAAIDQAMAAEGAPKDYLTYLKGRALYLNGQHDEAIAVYDGFEKAFPKSGWARRARFGKALALARKGDFRSAELIFRSEADYLLSVERKQEIADIYLEFADRYFKPPKEDEKPDYQKALEFYQKALEVGPKPEKQAEVELLVAQCQQNLGKLGEAAGLYEAFIKKHPDSPLELEARYRLGETRLAEGNGKLARRAWEDLLAKYPDSTSERIAEATFKLSRTWNIPQPQNDEELNLGTAALETFIEKFPGHKLASEAFLDIARADMHRGRYDDAAKALTRFLSDDRYKDREEIPDARNLLGACYQLQKKFDQALATWQEYLAKHPAHKAWREVQQQIINTEYLMAAEKYQAKQYDDARKLWTAFLDKYPLDPRDPQILYLFGRMSYDQEQWDAAIADWRRLVSKYPNTDFSSRAQFSIGAVLERKLGKLEEALEEYKKVTWGNFTNAARQAIARLTAKTMTVATERVFRSDETPKLRLVTRNIESVTVRAYKIDMETYFRKMHLARGVESLDIALIDPDATFEFKVPDYAKYQELESRVEVPLPGDLKAGVMAVTVSSKTLEATTLVIQSDLDVVVKSSRDEVFVFAENMLTGKPWPGARLLISNGKEVYAEETTREDGTFQKSYRELKDAGDVRVFAVAGGSIASNVVDLGGVGVAQGLADKGYIYTDRPAYRAGQLVHVRGCLRKVSDDRYTIEKDKKYTLEVFDSRDRLVGQEEVRLDEFGSFHGRFPLPPTSPQGEYRVVARDEDGQTYQGTFQVHQYQLEPVYLTIDTPRGVYYRGEEIEGTIRASYYYGAPLAGREVRYQLADERTYTATTDEKGEVKFKLPTREFNETQVLPLVVTLPERNLTTARNLVLSAQGFSIALKTVRPVYVAGETFEVTVTTNDAEGKPIGRKLALKVLEKTTVNGKVGERLVEERDVETADKDGIARQTFKLADGGRYVIRAEGTDRFHNPISGEYAVQISDDKDTIRLRILADQHTFKVGDTAKVILHWREEPALALVTFQGAKILDYRLVELKKGENPLEIPMTAVLAPNFELAVAVMTDPRPELAADKKAAKGAADAAAGGPGPGPEEEAAEKPVVRFHTASSPFTVQRELSVKIAARRKAGAEGPVQPGEEIEVSVTTTDPQGKPVAAELSLAMVEQSLLDRFAWQIATIDDFFRGVRREPAVRTTASVTFSYRPPTKPINPRLLAERDRLEIAREEAESRESFSADLTVTAGTAIASPAVASADPFAAPPAAPGSGTTGGRASGSGEASADFDSLIAAIESTASPSTWEDQPEGTWNGPVEVWRELTQQQVTADGGRGRVVLGFGGMGGGTFGGRQMGAQILQEEEEGAQITNGADLSGSDIQNRLILGVAPSFANHFAQTGNGQYWGYADVDADDVVNFVNQSGGQVIVLDKSGSMRQLALADGRFDHRQAEALAAELEKSGAVLLPGTLPQETGYWNPSVVTDAEGKATLTFTVPERSTAWQLLAKGITTDTLAGEASDKVVVKKDLFGQLKLPPSFTDGEKAQIEAAVHNDAIEKGPIEVVLKTTVGTRTLEEKKTLDVTAKGIEQVVFDVDLTRPAPAAEQDAAQPAPELDVAFELTVTAGQRSDVVRQAVPLKPYGMPVFATASGSAASDTTAWVEAPKGMTLERPGLQILIGPTVEQSLMDIVLGPAPWCQVEASRFAAGLESSTSDLMAALGLQKLMAATREAGGPQAQALESRIRSAIGLMVSSQNDDGGWSWTGRAGPSERYMSARAVWALALARQAGYHVPEDCYAKALGYLRDQVAATSESDYESKAILLHALAAAGQGDFALANRLYRNRPALSPAALAYVALAFAEMDRKPVAQELADLLAERNLDDPATRRKAEQGSLPWSHSPVELRALYALTLEQVSPQSTKLKEVVDWLMEHRTGYRWMPDKATGPAARALCQWFAQSRYEGEHYKLAVFVNDVEAAELDIDQTSGTRTIDVPERLLKPDGKQRINFELTGRGRYAYQCILGGFVPADKLASTTQDWRVERTYEPAPLEVDGREIARGFGVLQGSYSTFRNPLTQLPVGRRGIVELRVWREGISSSTPQSELEYLVITEPIPSGATVIEKSVQGPFERFEIGPGAITFYVGSRPYVGTIRYELYGYLPGSYRAAPTVIRDAHRPDQLAVAEPKSLAVLAGDQKSSDAYRLTPQELFELGKLAFDKGDMKTAGKHLAELVDKWNLNPEVYKEAIEKLLDVHLAIGPPAQVVRYFEIVKEKWPNAEIPFAKIAKVGAAYHEMGEYERSYLVFRATVESSFMRESRVAGFLESQGEFVRSVEVMNRLLREYPPEGYVAAATYALAQRVYAKAPEAADDANLRKLKINRVDLIRRAWSMLESFLTACPDDPAADQAAFAAASALLDLELYKDAAASCRLYADRYPKSELLDSYWYMIGYCEFATGAHQAALEMCRKVAEAKRIDPQTGREVEAQNKWRAIYILGQIYHSLGEAAKAIDEYRRVEERFPDARQSIEYFTRKAIELPEVTTLRPDEPAEVELKFRNIPACDTKVYRIDLMKFSLLKRDLEGITQINLAGIRPLHEATLKLGDGKDYRDRTEQLKLPLTEEGAYLVVCRGENLYASGLVLVTPLKIDVQEDAVSGRVRTTVKEAAEDRYERDVHVKVIGSQNDEFVSGETDLRGVYVADGIHGTATVIAQAEGPRYAFFRGTTLLAPETPKPEQGQPRGGQAVQPPAPPLPAATPKDALLKGLQDTNRYYQGKQVEQIQELYENVKGGVAPSEAF